MASSMASGSGEQDQSINIGVTYDMKVISVTTASSFAVHLQDRMDTIMHIQELAKKHGDSSPQLKGLQIGSVCLAKFEADSLWYRAVIREVDVDTDVATIYFIDFGNVDECSIGTDLKECPRDISQILPQIVECQWMYANPKGTGMREVIDKLEELAEEDVFIKAKVVDIQSTSDGIFLNYGDFDGPVVVDLEILEPLRKLPTSAPVLKDRVAAKAESEEVHVDHQQVDNDVVTPASRSIGDGDQLDASAAIQIPGSSKGSASLGHDETTTKLMASTSTIPQLATVNMDENTPFCTSSSTECVKTLDEIAIQIDLIKKQILKMTENAAAAATPKTRPMTPEEHAARMKECVLILNRRDRMIDCLLEMLTEKDNAIKMATRRNDEAREKYRIILQEKDEKLASLREMARKQLADSANM